MEMRDPNDHQQQNAFVIPSVVEESLTAKRKAMLRDLSTALHFVSLRSR